MNTILENAQELFDYSKKIRRTIHMNPELSFEEYETSKLVKQELDSFGIPWIAVGETGVVAVVQGTKSSDHTPKTVALRADMDALTIEEKTTVEFKSKVKGKMHACGHDVHTTMLLTAAKILNEKKSEFSGTVKLIFQPAEEMVSGANSMLKANNFFDDVDCIVGMHIMSFLPTGYFGFKDEGFMFGGERFEITVDGKSGHGAQPHTAVDALLAASGIVQNAQAIISQKIEPINGAVLTICTMQAGTRHNIIAGNAVMTGTIRFYNEEDRDILKNSLNRVVKLTSETFSAKGEVEWSQYVPASRNDVNMGKVLRKTITSLFGEKKVVETNALSGSDDMAVYQSRIPGYYVLLGCSKENQENYSQHHEKFCPDEDCMPIGAAAYVQFAMDLLNER